MDQSENNYQARLAVRAACRNLDNAIHYIEESVYWISPVNIRLKDKLEQLKAQAIALKEEQHAILATLNKLP